MTMKIHSQRHAALEIQYLNDQGALEDKLESAWHASFKTEDEVTKWRTDFKTAADPVFEPLSQYFAGRARVQKAVMVAGLAPLGLGAYSALTAGLTSGSIVLGALGLGLMLGAQMGLGQSSYEIAALGSTKFEMLRNAERIANEKLAQLKQTSSQPAAAPPAVPAPVQPKA